MFAHNALNTGIPSAATTAPECGSGGAGAVAACSSTMVLPNGTTATTQATGSNDTKVATDGLVVAAIPTGATTAPRCGSGAAGSDSSCTGTLVLPNGTTATTQATSSNDTKVATDGLVFAALPSLATTAPDCGTGTAGARQACTGTLVLPSGTTATTQTGGTNNTTVATTAYANSAVSTAIPSAATTAPECGSGGAGAVAACGATMVLPNGAAATLQTVSDNSTKVATDSFVAQAIPSAATTAPECGGGAVGLVGACSATMVLPSGTTATLQSAGDNSTKVATDSYVYQALSTVASLTTTTGSATLSAAQYSQPLVKQTGTLSANVTYTVPNSWLAVWENLSTGAFTTTVKTSAGTGVIVPQGQTVALLADGTNVVVVNAENVQIFTSSGTATLPTNFTGAWIKAAAGGGGGGGGANVVNSTGAGSGGGGGGGGAFMHANVLHRGGIRLVAVYHNRCWRHARRRRGGVQQRQRQWRWQRRHDDDRHAGPARRRRRWPGRRLDGRERRRGRRHDRPERQRARCGSGGTGGTNALGVTNATLGGAGGSGVAAVLTVVPGWGGGGGGGGATGVAGAGAESVDSCGGGGAGGGVTTGSGNNNGGTGGNADFALRQGGGAGGTSGTPAGGTGSAASTYSPWSGGGGGFGNGASNGAGGNGGAPTYCGGGGGGGDGSGSGAGGSGAAGGAGWALVVFVP